MQTNYSAMLSLPSACSKAQGWHFSRQLRGCPCTYDLDKAAKACKLQRANCNGQEDEEEEEEERTQGVSGGNGVVYYMRSALLSRY